MGSGSPGQAVPGTPRRSVAGTGAPGSPSRRPRRSGPRFATATSVPRAWPDPPSLSGCRAWNSFLLSSGVSSMRRPAMPSPVTCPRVTSSHRARSVRTVRCPVPRAMSVRRMRRGFPGTRRRPGRRRTTPGVRASPGLPDRGSAAGLPGSRRPAARIVWVWSLRVFPSPAGGPGAPRPTAWLRPDRPPARRCRAAAVPRSPRRQDRGAPNRRGHSPPSARPGRAAPRPGPATPCPEAAV